MASGTQQSYSIKGLNFVRTNDDQFQVTCDGPVTAKLSLNDWNKVMQNLGIHEPYIQQFGNLSGGGSPSSTSGQR